MSDGDVEMKAFEILTLNSSIIFPVVLFCYSICYD